MKKKKKKWKILLISLFLWAAFSWLSGDSGIINQLSIYHANKNLLGKVDSLVSLKEQLDRERGRLWNDTAYLEKVIRAELGWAAPNEKVYRLYQDSGASGRTPKKAGNNISFLRRLLQLKENLRQ